MSSSSLWHRTLLCKRARRLSSTQSSAKSVFRRPPTARSCPTSTRCSRSACAGGLSCRSRYPTWYLRKTSTGGGGSRRGRWSSRTLGERSSSPGARPSRCLPGLTEVRARAHDCPGYSRATQRTIQTRRHSCPSGISHQTGSPIPACATRARSRSDTVGGASLSSPHTFYPRAFLNRPFPSSVEFQIVSWAPSRRSGRVRVHRCHATHIHHIAAIRRPRPTARPESAVRYGLPRVSGPVQTSSSAHGRVPVYPLFGVCVHVSIRALIRCAGAQSHLILLFASGQR